MIDRSRDHRDRERRRDSCRARRRHRSSGRRRAARRATRSRRFRADREPSRTSSVEQEAADAVLTFTYPDRLLDGSPLTDLSAIEVYRVVNPSPALVATPRPGAPFPAAPGAPADGRRRRPPERGRRRPTSASRRRRSTGTRSASRRCRSPSSRGARAAPRSSSRTRWRRSSRGRSTPTSLAYAVVSVRRGGEKSPLSNIVTLSPEVPPAAPVLLAVTPEEGRICLEWLAARQGPARPARTRRSAATSSIAGRSPRRTTAPPLNAEAVRRGRRTST